MSNFASLSTLGGGGKPLSRNRLRQKKYGGSSVKLLLFLTVSGLLIGLSGCGPSGPPKPPGFPDTVPCVITITQESGPLDGALVELHPTDGAQDWLVRGTTNESGVAKMRTYGLADGAPKGKYKVVVTKIETEPGLPEPDWNDLAAVERFNQSSNQIRPSHNLVETVYGNVTSTTLELDVSGKTEQTFDVGKTVRAPAK